MAAPVDLRNDFDSVSLRRLAKRTRDATQSRRLLALAEVYDGGSRTDASRIGGVGLQIIRDWVLRFNARGPDGLVDGKSPGAPSKLNADHRRALAEVVEAGPVPAVELLKRCSTSRHLKEKPRTRRGGFSRTLKLDGFLADGCVPTGIGPEYSADRS